MNPLTSRQTLIRWARMNGQAVKTSNYASEKLRTFLSFPPSDRALSVSWEAGVGESLGKLYLNTDRLEEAQATFSAVLARHPDRLSTRVYLVSGDFYCIQNHGQLFPLSVSF